MCGILGLSIAPGVGVKDRDVERLLEALFVLSESRGKEASGVAVAANGDIRVLKQATAATEMVKTRPYRELVRRSEGGRAIIGHSRLVTNGVQYVHGNNQPVMSGGVVGIHNGIVVDVEQVWQRFPMLERTSDLDSEVLFALIRHFQKESGSLVRGVRAAYEATYGVANIAALFEDFDQLLLATNNGSIYTWRSTEAPITMFASEAYVLETMRLRPELARILGRGEIAQLAPGQAALLDLESGRLERFSLAGAEEPVARNGIHRAIVDVSPRLAPSRPARPRNESVPARLHEAHERNRAAIAQLRRCVKCVHPETLPYVDLDRDGVCAYCRDHRRLEFKGPEALARFVEPYRRNGRADVLVPLSGGRDSCYALHYIKRELGMNPIAYTYDWGMVTDLARRNASRMCSKLGVEHIIVSADITEKREFIRKNVEAWMKKPDLGTVPLFMAGDKQFFYYAEQLKSRTGVDLLMFAMNPLERTDFKHGFCGISGGGTEGSFFRLDLLKNLQIAGYYGLAYLKNPAYINASLLDTLFAYFAYYVMPHEYALFYDYIRWDEQTVERTLLDGYDWEMSPDTKSTWRIGDGTASFYNYIYYTVAGFTENDTFRSFQIREGVLDRETALARMLDENVPRYESIAWYCDTIGIDMVKALDTIQAIPKLYRA